MKILLIQKGKIMNTRTCKLLLTGLFFLIGAGLSFGQTTGKIAGKVVDKKTNEPLVGANVVLMGTTMGAAVDFDGEYFIINIPPGKYDLKFSVVGYAPYLVKDIVVSVNRTTTVDAEMESADLAIGEVVVSVSGLSERKDQTSSINNVSADQIKTLPVENVGEVIGLQAGVVQGHFRGGRTTEVSYMVDGVPVTDSYSRDNNKVDIETEAVQDMEVITGTFNAEYGRAMSGIVNIVTKEGSKRFHASASTSLSNYFTTHDDIFIGTKAGDVTRNQDYKIQLEGPIYSDYITFFANARYQDDQGYLNGIRRFSVNDYTDFGHADMLGGVTTPWDVMLNGNKYYSEHTGDEAYVAMAPDKNYSLLGKITFRPITNLKFSLMYAKNYDEKQKYGKYENGDDFYGYK